MKSVKIISLAWALMFTQMLTAQTISVDDLTLAPNEVKSISINLSDGSTAVASGFYMMLTGSLTFADDVAGETDGHIFKTCRQNDNTLKVAIYSNQNNCFSNDARLLSIPVKAGSAEGRFKGIITGVEFVSEALSLTNKGNITFSINVEEGTRIGVLEQRERETPVYNLQGQRVNSNAKGILIKNGKKIICK